MHTLPHPDDIFNIHLVKPVDLTSDGVIVGDQAFWKSFRHLCPPVLLMGARKMFYASMLPFAATRTQESFPNRVASVFVRMPPGQR